MVDKPAIQYVVEEAVKVGLHDVLMITGGRSKRALEDHFDRVPALEATLAEKGDTAKLEAIQSATNLGDIHYVRRVTRTAWATQSFVQSSMLAMSLRRSAGR